MTSFEIVMSRKINSVYTAAKLTLAVMIIVIVVIVIMISHMAAGFHCTVHTMGHIHISHIHMGSTIGLTAPQ